MIDENSFFLIADDAVTSRQLIINMLTDLGYDKFVEAVDGEDAWQKLKKSGNNFGIILCDWNMPKLNGLDLLKRIKGDPKLADLPFIMVTAESDFEHASSALLNGADNYVTKPFDIHVLRIALNQTISSYNKTIDVVRPVSENTEIFKKMVG